MEGPQQQATLKEQAEKIQKMCLALGIHKMVFKGDEKILSYMGVSYYPYELQKSIYDNLKKLHFIWVKLIVAVSRDKEFVNKVFEQTVKYDSYVCRFLDLYNKYIEHEIIGVDCVRLDYMGDEQPKLVEFNLMSIGFNGISDRVQYLSSLYKRHRSQGSVQYPINTNQKIFLDAIQTAIHKKFDVKSVLILMVVHEQQQKWYNFGDQNAFEMQALARGHRVKITTMSRLIRSSTLNKTNQLVFEGQVVSVVYFRTGYSPAHYTTQNHWTLIENIQKSRAIGVPSISMQLVNFKRMQTQLCDIQVLNKFLERDQATLIHSVMTDTFHFQNSQNCPALVEKFIKGDYVLKTNRQGGGNNHFGQDAIKFIELIKDKPGQLQKYMAMKTIPSRIDDNYFMTPKGFFYVKESTSQVSTFGAFCYEKDKLFFNQSGGTLIRLKKKSDNQGGISLDKAVVSGICVTQDIQKL